MSNILETRTSFIQETKCHENIKAESFSSVQRTAWFKSKYTVIHPEHCGKTKSTRESHPIQSRVMLQNAIKSQQIDLIKPRIILEIVRMRIHKWNEWVNGWKPKRPWSQHQISYLKPMDWARLETFRNERISRSGRNLGEASVRFFFSSSRCKKSNHQVRSSRCWSEIWSTYLRGRKVQDD